MAENGGRWRQNMPAAPFCGAYFVGFSVTQYPG